MPMQVLKRIHIASLLISSVVRHSVAVIWNNPRCSPRLLRFLYIKGGQVGVSSARWTWRAIGLWVSIGM